MADEPAKIILGDTDVAAVQRRPRRDRELRLSHCENCDAQLYGHWCSQCGQAAIDYRRSFRHVIADVLDSFFNWDSKFFATITWLIVRPWYLTNEFLRGRRVTYLHPLRLYLLASILFFFAVNYWAKSIHVDGRQLSADQRAEVKAEFDKENLPPEVRAKLEKSLAPIAPTAPVSLKEAAQSSPAPPQNEKPFLEFNSDHSSSTPFERWLETQAKEKLGEQGTKLQLFLAALFHNLPYMMLCCIPLFALVLKLLYIRRHIFYTDHLVYALHIHTFSYIGIMIIVLATLALSRTAPHIAGAIATLLWLTFAMLIFLSIRYVYQQTWFVSVVKFFVGGFVYLIVLSLAVIATLLITLASPG